MTKDRQQNTRITVSKGVAGQADGDLRPAATEVLLAAVQEAKGLLLALEATGATHVAICVAGIEIEIDRAPGTVLSPAVATPAPGGDVSESNLRSAEVGGVLIAAPLVGIFYRAPAPGAKPFVEVGQPVSTGQ
jgi:acetyl-CoA carboxylase biotin carboxyl carrier protein